jgi:shikimate dehydrogenase
MRQFGLIGYPLAHSFSKIYFQNKFEKERIDDAQYDIYPLQKLSDLPYLVRAVNPLGLNVTIPHKEAVIPYLDAMDKVAHEVGAVNVIKIKDETLVGYNTDVYGFEQSLIWWFRKLYKAEAFKRPIQNAYILGTGGASKAVAYVTTHKMFMKTIFVSRTPKEETEISYDTLNEIIRTSYEPTLIVNTTPVGTFPETDNAPDLAYLFLKPNFYLYDLVYNPADTLFMRKGLEQGCYVKNGLEMLHLQAERAWEIWNQDKESK